MRLINREIRDIFDSHYPIKKLKISGDELITLEKEYPYLEHLIIKPDDISFLGCNIIKNKNIKIEIDLSCVGYINNFLLSSLNTLHITNLNLNNTRLDCNFFEYISSVKKLHISKINNVICEYISSLINLPHINFLEIDFYIECPNALSCLSNLTSLIMHDYNKPLSFILSPCPSLKELKIDMEYLCNMDIIDTLPNLDVLHLSSKKYLFINNFNNISNLINLSSLTLDNFYTTNKLIVLSCLTKLITLYIDTRLYINYGGLSFLSYLKNLKDLTLYNSEYAYLKNEIEDNYQKTLTANNILNHEISVISQLTNLQTLKINIWNKYLFLDNKIGFFNSSLRYLLPLKQLQFLTWGQFIKDKKTDFYLTVIDKLDNLQYAQLNYLSDGQTDETPDIIEFDFN